MSVLSQCWVAAMYLRCVADDDRLISIDRSSDDHGGWWWHWIGRSRALFAFVFGKICCWVCYAMLCITGVVGWGSERWQQQQKLLLLLLPFLIPAVSHRLFAPDIPTAKAICNLPTASVE